MRLDEQELKDILTTAIEGGIGYWACLCNDEEDWIKTSKEWKEEHNDFPCYCDVAYDLLEKGLSVKLEDEEEGKAYSLTKENFSKGIDLFEKEYGSIRRKLEEGSFDACDADAVIQLSLFGEVIYG